MQINKATFQQPCLFLGLWNWIRNLSQKKDLMDEPYRIRTCDPLIKSQMLYRLS